MVANVVKKVTEAKVRKTGKETRRLRKSDKGLYEEPSSKLERLFGMDRWLMRARIVLFSKFLRSTETAGNRVGVKLTSL